MPRLKGADLSQIRAMRSVRKAPRSNQLPSEVQRKAASGVRQETVEWKELQPLASSIANVLETWYPPGEHLHDPAKSTLRWLENCNNMCIPPKPGLWFFLQYNKDVITGIIAFTVPVRNRNTRDGRGCIVTIHRTFVPPRGRKGIGTRLVQARALFVEPNTSSHLDTNIFGMLAGACYSMQIHPTRDRTCCSHNHSCFWRPVHFHIARLLHEAGICCSYHQ